jgi:hypothetical protein
VHAGAGNIENKNENSCAILTAYGMRVRILLFMVFWKATPTHVLTGYGFRLVKLNMHSRSCQAPSAKRKKKIEFYSRQGRDSGD